MAYEKILEEIKDLSEQKQNEVLDFILFLKTKDHSSQKSENTTKRELGALEGRLIYIADDFDETPECFKEYV
ncbi:MAG: DUF2281 domain-containing protein [Lachnospiraceae bacterium]|nr:DUF2281 domain-containing protein [Lachnospiraceae bacterium]